MKKNLLSTLIIILLICLAVMPCAFAEEADAVVEFAAAEVSVQDTSAAVDTVAPAEVISSAEPVTAEEAFSAVETAPVEGNISETEASPVVENTPEAETLHDEAEAPCDETAPPETGITAEAEVPSVDIPSAEETEPVSPEADIPPERAVPVRIADFTGKDGTVRSLELGGCADLAEFISSLGYEGEIESFVSSNPEALGLDEEGRLVFRSAFTDETVTVVVNGEEVVIPVHDPRIVAVNVDTGTLYTSVQEAIDTSVLGPYREGPTIQMLDDCAENITVGADKTVTLDLCGYTLSAAGDGSVIYVEGILTLTDSSSSGTGTVTGGTGTELNGETYGGGVYAGGLNSNFIMEGGTISGNTADYGGGVYVTGNACFTMTGGTISGNSAGKGGGLYVDCDKVKLGGTAVIGGNTLTGVETANNMYLPDGITVDVSSPQDGMKIGVTLEAGEGSVTKSNGEAAKRFAPDDPDYAAVNEDGVVKLVSRSEFAAVNVGTEELYRTVQEAVDAVSAAGDENTIRILKDVQENLSIGNGRNIILDLNGHVLKGNGDHSVISGGNSNLTIIDSDPDTVHTGALPAGGVITGGKDTMGGGVSVGGKLTLSGGTITGNTAANGGGVYVGNYGEFRMTGGEISNNTATGIGGGVFAGWICSLEGGTITGNTAANGGGVYVDCLGVSLGGTAVIYGNTLTDGITANNLYLTENRILDISTEAAPQAGMKIGITTEEEPENNYTVKITDADGTGVYARYFTADNPDYAAVNKDGHVKLISAAGSTVAVNLDTGAEYSTVQDAIDCAGSMETIRIIQNVQENITVGSGQEIILDLNGKTLSGTGSGSVITVNGKLTVTDKNSGGKITGGAGTVDGTNQCTYGGGVYVSGRGAEFTLAGGTVTGNEANTGAGVYVSGSGAGFVMTGGEISGNTATVKTDGDRKFGGNGAGLFVNSGAAADISGGRITGNTAAVSGGGVYVQISSGFAMTGGEISGNKASENGAGVYDYGTVTLGGTAIISGNTIGDTQNNLYLKADGLSGQTTVVIGTGAEEPRTGMEISVTTETIPGQGSPVAVTSDDVKGEFARYFMADDPDFVAVDRDGIVVLMDMEELAVAINTTTLVEYITVQEAIQAAANGETVQLLKDVQENVAVAAEKDIILDLNGNTLSGAGDGSVITVSGKLALEDSSSGKTGEITGGTGSTGGGVYVNDKAEFTMNGGKISGNQNSAIGGGVFVAQGGTFNMDGGEISSNKAVMGSAVYTAGTFNMSGGDISVNSADYGSVYVDGSGVFTMTGGEISGNSASSGGGVFIVENKTEGTFNMDGGKITGNTAKRGGGVHVERSDFNMTGGEISGNSAEYGAGVLVNGLNGSGTMTITGGTITGNTASNDGGGVYNDDGSVTMSGGSISKNTADCGGGVESSGIFNMDGGSIGGNTAAAGGGGVYVYDGEVTVGGNAKITGNTTGGSADNLFLPDGKTVTVSTDTAPNGMNIGVTTQPEPTETARVTITGSNIKDYSKNFTSDKSSFKIVNGNDNQLQLRHKDEPKPHTEPAVPESVTVAVYIDGELLREGEDYSWVNGKVVLTGKFINTLENGEHILTIIFPDRVEEETFNITDGSVIPEKDSSYLAEILIEKSHLLDSV